jgi:hypothetical protein
MKDESRPVADQDESRFSKLWRWWKITWAVIRNLLYIALVILAFGKASPDFENLVLCLLILILQSINWTHTTQIRLTVEEAFVNRRMLFTLQKAAGEDTSEATEIVDEAEKNYDKSNPLYYINMVGATVVYLIVIWKLFTTLVIR